MTQPSETQLNNEALELLRAGMCGLSNDELKAAIEYAWLRLNTTGSIYPHHAPMLEHYKALLKEQERRATLAAAPAAGGEKP